MEFVIFQLVGWLHKDTQALLSHTSVKKDSFIFFGAFQQHQTESYVPIVVLCCILSEKHKILKYFASILSDLQPKAFARLIPYFQISGLVFVFALYFEYLV